MRRRATSWASVVARLLVAACWPTLASAQLLIGSGDVRIVGVQSVRLEIVDDSGNVLSGGAALQVPTHTGFALQTRLVGDAAVFGSGPLYVQGQLSGPGLGQTGDGSSATGAIALDPVAPGAPLQIPALAQAGNYVVDHLRLTDATGTTLLAATPAVVPIAALDKIIVTSVSARPLSLDEIQDQGLLIDPSDFTAYQFTFGLQTSSPQAPIPFDILFPKGGGAAERGGGEPPDVPGLSLPNFDVTGFLFTAPDDLDPAIQLPPIPGVIVIPGNIAFLHQFFQVMVLTSNVAPAGSQLIVTSAVAELALPPGDDGQAQTADDPLAPGRTANPPPADAMCDAAYVAPPGLCTTLDNTQDHTRVFGPGENAQGDFTVEGRRVGTYEVTVTIKATLQLPTGQIVPLEGKAIGTVLVRDPTFSLTINHPDVVRAGETYSLFVTIHNIGAVPANVVTLHLDPSHITGATLVSNSDDTPVPPTTTLAPGTAQIPTIAAGDAATVEYRLIARQSGRVTAAGSGRFGERC